LEIGPEFPRHQERNLSVNLMTRGKTSSLSWLFFFLRVLNQSSVNERTPS